jgi:aconitate hydratase
LIDRNGKAFKLESPNGLELPPKGFDPGQDTYQPPAVDGKSISVVIDPKSERIQELKPFEAWDGKNLVFFVMQAFTFLKPVLLKYRLFTMVAQV